jgi:hypothetical protein
MSASSSTIRMSDAMVFGIDRRRVNVLPTHLPEVH